VKPFKGNKESTKGRFLDTFLGILGADKNLSIEHSTYHRGPALVWRADAFSHLRMRGKCHGTWSPFTASTEQISLLTRRPVGWSRRRTKIRDSRGYFQVKRKSQR